METKWRIEGEAIGSCSCNHGCPCNFNAPPSQGFCEGGYVFQINEGHANGTKLDGLAVSIVVHFPQAVHLGNGTGVYLIDQKASREQRDVLNTVLLGKAGGVFGIFSSLMTKMIGPEYVPAEVTIDGSNSFAHFGDIFRVHLAPATNPVTGAESGFTLLMTSGLLTNKSELMTTSEQRLSHPELSYGHPGQYGEIFRFDLSGEG